MPFSLFRSSFRSSVLSRFSQSAAPRTKAAAPKLRAIVCLGLGLTLAACSTGWESLDNLTRKHPQPQTQTAKSESSVASKTPKRTRPPAPALTVERNAPPPTPSQSAAVVAPAAQASPSALPSSPVSTDGTTRVALLLPLSGKNAALGQAMLNAAQIAVFDLAPRHFELMPRDTNATPQGSAQAARDAIASGAQLLIGPLFAQDVLAVKPIAQASNVSMLALSTDVTLADQGVYVMGFAPSPQVERVIAYASAQGARRFAAIIPQGAYGKLVQKTFEDAVHKHGGMVVGLNSPAQVQALAAKKDQIDALLLPLGGEELRQTVAQLGAIGLDRTKVHLLGTGLWDEPGLGARLGLLVGGWYAASEPEARANFIQNYKNTYGQEPPRLATLPYDATALAAVLTMRQEGQGRFDQASMTNPNGFAGLDGIFRLTPQGMVERGLAINEITPEGNKVIDPSPSTFSGP